LDYGISNWILKFADNTKLLGSIATEKHIVNCKRTLID